MLRSDFFCYYRTCRILLLLVTLAGLHGNVWAALGASVTLKSGQPTDIYPGQTTELVITVSNDSTTAEVANGAFNSNLPGVFPDGLKIAGSATYLCTNSTGSVPTQGTLTATVGTQTIPLLLHI